MRIAVFGGSFNPVHIGHIEIVTRVLEKLYIDRILIIPTYIPPHKRQDMEISPRHRLSMCGIAFGNLKSAVISDIEIKRGGESYTYLTLQELKKRFPDDDLFLIMGADMFLSVQDWKNADIIFSLAAICGVPRNRGNLEVLKKHSAYLETLGAKASACDIEVPSVSSTQIREMCMRGEDIGELVPPMVEAYINFWGLYKSKQ